MPPAELLAALRLIEEDPIVRRTFQSLTERLGQSGWAVAKSLDHDPKEVVKALQALTNAGVIRATDSGLEGNYSLTDLGFSLKEQITSRFSRSR